MSLLRCRFERNDHAVESVFQQRRGQPVCAQEADRQSRCAESEGVQQETEDVGRERQRCCGSDSQTPCAARFEYMRLNGAVFLMFLDCGAPLNQDSFHAR